MDTASVAGRLAAWAKNLEDFGNALSKASETALDTLDRVIERLEDLAAELTEGDPFDAYEDEGPVEDGYSNNYMYGYILQHGDPMMQRTVSTPFMKDILMNNRPTLVNLYNHVQQQRAGR